MPKPIKKKVLKKTKPEEDFKIEVVEFKDKIREYKFIIISALVILLMIIGFIIYKVYSSSKAVTLFYEGYSAFYSSSQGVNPFMAYSKGIEALKESYRLRPDPITLLYISDGYYRMGSLDEAKKSLDEFKKKYSDNRYLMPLCYQRLAMVYKKKGLTDEAIKVYDELYQKGFTLRDLGLYESARLLLESKRQDEASKRIEILKKEFPNSPYLSLLTSVK